MLVSTFEQILGGKMMNNWPWRLIHNLSMRNWYVFWLSLLIFTYRTNFPLKNFSLGVVHQEEKYYVPKTFDDSYTICVSKICTFLSIFDLLFMEQLLLKKVFSGNFTLKGKNNVQLIIDDSYKLYKGKIDTF